MGSSSPGFFLFKKFSLVSQIITAEKIKAGVTGVEIDSVDEVEDKPPPATHKKIKA